MTLHRILDRNAPSTNGGTGRRVPRGILATALTVLTLAACAGGGEASVGAVVDESEAPAGADATGTTDPATHEQIPPGREIAEGGGGPAQYTFREEWRKALAEAQTWRSGAYLISAAGNMINDEGVPSYWSLVFIDKPDADAVLLVDIDPWGAVTQTREVSGDGVGSFVGQYTTRIPYGIVDSDTAVGLGMAALASGYDLTRTKDPRIDLGFDRLDGSGPYWSYTLFNEPTAEYVSARIDALTGEVLPPS